MGSIVIHLPYRRSYSCDDKMSVVLLSRMRVILNLRMLSKEVEGRCRYSTRVCQYATHRKNRMFVTFVLSERKRVVVLKKGNFLKDTYHKNNIVRTLHEEENGHV